MVFQDFDQISERRKLERQRKFRKRVTIAAVTAFVLIILIASGVFAVITVNKSGSSKAKSSPSSPSSSENKPSGNQPSENKPSENKPPPKAANAVSKSQKLIQTMCNGTMYKDSCQKTLTKASNNKNPDSAQPKEFLKYAVQAIADEVQKAIKEAEDLKINSDEEKAAFNVCKKVVEDAKEELEKSVAQVNEIKEMDKLNETAYDMNNWLSAVMSYSETCIDNFPDGELKSDMKKAFNSSKQLTSNSLAMIKQVSSYVTSMTQTTGTARRLLEWGHEKRRLLKGADVDKPEPNVTVAKDGSGNYSTISEALSAIPGEYDGRYVIYIKEGTYEESVTVTKKMVNLTMYGDGSQKTIITGNKNLADGVRVYETATFVVLGEGFMGKSMGFKNTAGPDKRVAVAVRNQADQSIFLNCRFEGYEGTLYAQTHRQIYKSCVIVGTVDFIFGDAAALFQNCLITVRKPQDGQQNVITAQERIDKFETTGFVLQNCQILPDDSLGEVKSQVKSYLGRPKKEYSRTIVMESTIEDFISPEGWVPMEGDFGTKTLFYAEYDNKGPGSKMDSRVDWPGLKELKKEEAAGFTVGTFLKGEWINETGAPLHFGLFEN